MTPALLLAADAFRLSHLVGRIAMWIMVGFFALMILFALLIFITALCERQYLTGDIEPASEPYPYPPSGYWRVTRNQATTMGLLHVGDFATRKGTSLTKGLVSLFFTQDRQTLVAIVSDSFAGAKSKKTVLRSKVSTGQILESSDNPGIEDLSGVIERAILYNAGLGELMEFHYQRLKNCGSSLVPFDADGVREQYEQIDLDRGGRWVSLGVARWADPHHTSIRMNVRGALALLLAMPGQILKLSDQKQRSRIRRAGG